MVPSSSSVGPWSPELHRKSLTGWGRYPRTNCQVIGADPSLVASLLADPEAPSVIARGAGRSYGDAALSSAGVVLQVPPAHEVQIDAAAGTLRAVAGVSVARASEAALEHGLFLPVLPGTGAVTLGGAIAADIHGKNHHRDGSIGHHVRTVVLRTADGVRRTLDVGDSSAAALLELTIGGMGLTGLIEEIELSLVPVPSSWMRSEARTARDLDESVELLLWAEERWRYTVAWIDAFASGAGFGRGIVIGGDHAELSDLPPSARGHPFDVPPTRSAPFPFLGDGLLWRGGVRLLNGKRFSWATRRSGETKIEPWHQFFFPLDRVREWNRFYGRRGFRQHQCVLPSEESAAGVRSILDRLRDRNHPPTLAVLKGLGEGRGGISFPRPGLTLALDFPRRSGLDALLDEIDAEVADRGGTIYLAKDAGITAERFEAMTPSLPAFRDTLVLLDPGRRFVSDLALRIGLR